VFGNTLGKGKVKCKCGGILEHKDVFRHIFDVKEDRQGQKGHKEEPADQKPTKQQVRQWKCYQDRDMLYYLVSSIELLYSKGLAFRNTEYVSVYCFLIGVSMF